MENAKQKAIEKAYGEYWDKVKDFVDENGWIVKRRYNPFTEELEVDRTEMLDLENIFEYKTFHSGNEVSVRPKSLSGIETNLNWISINSEEDLPKEDLDCFVVEGNLMTFAVYDEVLKSFYSGMNKIKKPTHYQPIILPKKPIY